MKNEWLLPFVFILMLIGLSTNAAAVGFSGLVPGQVKQQRIGDTLDGPELKCLNFSDTANLQLSWLPVNDPSNSFHCYVIYRSSNLTGPYSVVDSIFNRTQNSLTDLNSGALPGKYYFISTISEVNSNTFVEMPGDTLQSIALTVISPGVNSGKAQLDWNSLYPVQKPSPAPTYLIEKKINAGPWVLYDSTSTLTYTDTISECSADFNYRIRLQDSSFCYSQSNFDGGTFKDKIPPTTPVTDTVSVENGFIHIAWNRNPVEDTWGYIIFKKINNLWTPLDTLFGRNNIHHIDSAANGCSEVNVYNVLAFDSCWNTSSSGINHHNMVLNLNYDICNEKVELSWNGYINMQPALKEYRIYKRKGVGNFQLLNVNNPGDTSFVDSSLISGNSYCYYVKALNTSWKKTSSTCTECIFHKSPPAPSFVYLSTATISHADQAVLIRGITDSTKFVKQINLYRSEQKNAGYNLITSIPGSQAGSFSYLDTDANYDQREYYYKAYAVDSCGNEATESNTVNTIYLKPGQLEFMKNRIQWNPFQGWPGSPPVYNVYRNVNPVAQFQEIVSGIPYNTGTFQEDVSALYNSDGNFEYYVVAYETYGNPYGLKDSSVSNIASCKQKSKIYIPNAFRPKGYNKVFKPFNVFIEFDEYQMIIYNRWGQQVFLSDNPNEGWDGQYKGSPAKAGVYAYYLTYSTKSGQTRHRKGTVMLIR